MQAYCCYKLPQQSDFYELKGSVISLQNFSEINNKTGFVFAPFNHNADEILFLEGHFTKGLTRHQIAFPEIDLHIKTTSELTFEALFNKTLAEIRSQNAEKIVISKIKVIDSPTAFNPLVFIKKLSSNYPNAFVYLFATETHCWLGASPEVLLTYENGLAETVSLAGTISEDQSQRFSEKEREEQAIITSYIEKTLNEFDIKAVSKSMPKPVQAGLLTHLQTQFSFSILPNKILEMLEKLHPTPAVCGMPKAFSKEFILQNESHQRAYYSGFLGPVSENRFSLFVNLRCAQIFKKSMILYAGAGITKDSVFIKEWDETEAKFGTILNELKDYSS
jgi:isochorismate synthase